MPAPFAPTTETSVPGATFRLTASRTGISFLAHRLTMPVSCEATVLRETGGHGGWEPLRLGRRLGQLHGNLWQGQRLAAPVGDGEDPGAEATIRVED